MPQGDPMTNLAVDIIDDEGALTHADNYTAMVFIIGDMVEREGLEATKAQIDQVLEQIEAGVN